MGYRTTLWGVESVSSTRQDTTRDADSDGQRRTGSTSPFIAREDNRRPAGSREAARQTYRTLLRTGAGRQWLLRAAACAAAALVAGLLTGNWRVGVTIGAAVLVALIIHTARRQSEVPQWRKPSAAQRRTEAQLKVMQRFGYRVLHARRIQDGNGQIDHFIVGRRGAFAIDSESWDRRLPLRNKLEQLYHGRFSKNERIDEALAEARNAERLISKELNREIKVRASLAIYGPSMPWDSHRLRGVDIITGTKVRKWLRSGKDRLSEEEIEEIYQAAQRVLPARY